VPPDRIALGSAPPISVFAFPIAVLKLDLWKCLGEEK
jgi:hypothetical protein